ncbi:hypothetical protein PQR02_29640 [Paraburkholderia sediminicola]|uniref:Uncharacterized protein n=1 Tax=Paraburkholderia rhynchosiae TaxID=487049 RepID=A0ACC7NJL4_9BURK
MKGGNAQSLRFQVEKWLAPGPAVPVRVIEFSRTRLGRRRYVRVRVETTQPGSVRTLFFFRHDDGCWHVFPHPGDGPQIDLSPDSELP